MIIPQIIVLVALSQLSPITIDITADQGIDVVLEDVIIRKFVDNVQMVDNTYKIPTKFVYNIESENEGNIYININHKQDIINDWCMSTNAGTIYNTDLFGYFNITAYNPVYKISTNFSELTIHDIDDIITIPIIQRDTQLSINLECELTDDAYNILATAVLSTGITTGVTGLLIIFSAFIIRQIMCKTDNSKNSRHISTTISIVTTIIMVIIRIFSPLVMNLPPLYVVELPNFFVLFMTLTILLKTVIDNHIIEQSVNK